jgi:hypothetical protein
MPNNKPDCPGKGRVDALLDKASKDLEKLTNAHPDLANDMDLNNAKQNLRAIPQDNHRPR